MDTRVLSLLSKRQGNSGDECREEGYLQAAEENTALKERNAELTRALERLESEAYRQHSERSQLLDALFGTAEGSREHIFAAEAATDPATTTAVAIRQLTGGCLSGVPLDIGTLAAALREEADKIVAGDIDSIKRLLAAQLLLADALAKDSLRRADDPPAIPGKPETAIGYRQAMLEVALKAMAQTARTAKNLVELDAPAGHTYVRAQQANIAAGHQQVNNLAEPQLESQILESTHDLGSNVGGLDAGKTKETVPRSA